MKHLKEDLIARHEQRMGQVYINTKEYQEHCTALALLTIAEELQKLSAILCNPPVIIHPVDQNLIDPGQQPAQFVRLNPNGHPCIASAIEDGFKALTDLMRDIPDAIREGNPS